jgi:hypothetical protein
MNPCCLRYKNRNLNVVPFKMDVQKIGIATGLWNWIPNIALLHNGNSIVDKTNLDYKYKNHKLQLERNILLQWQ